MLDAEVEVDRYAAIDTQRSLNHEWVTCHVYIPAFHRFYFTRSFFFYLRLKFCFLRFPF